MDEVIPQTDKNKQRIVDEYNIDVAYTENVSSTILKETLQLQPQAT